MTSSNDSEFLRMLQERTSRRTLLRGAALGGAGLAAAALVGCGDDDDDAPAPAAATAAPAAATAAAATPAPTPTPDTRRGGVFKYTRTSLLAGAVDPHQSTSTGWFLWQFIGDHAVRRTRDASAVVGELVESWEPTPDGLSMTMNVRPGVTWHNKPPINGREVDAEDIVYNFERIAGRYADAEETEVGRYQRRGTVAGMETATAVDATTLNLTFDRPRGSFLWGLTDGRNSMVPKEFLAEGGDFNDPVTAVGTGPFVLDEYDNEVTVKLSRNPNWWKPGGLPYLDGVEFVFLADKTALMAAFTQGVVDLFAGPNKVEQDTLAKLGGGGQRHVMPESVLWPHWRFNTKVKPFDDPRVRLALQRVPDYKAAGDAYYGEAWRFSGPLASGYGEAYKSDEIAQMPGWNPNTKEADITEARQLMSAAGFPDGEFDWKLLLGVPAPTTNWYDSSTRAVDSWKTVWPDMGVELDLPTDIAAFSKRQNSREGWDAVCYTILGQPDPVLELHSQYHSEGSRNYGNFSDATIDSLIDQASMQFDIEERGQTIKQVQDLLIQEHMPIIQIYVYLQINYWSERMRGAEEIYGLEGTFEPGQRGRDYLWIAK